MTSTPNRPAKDSRDDRVPCSVCGSLHRPRTLVRLANLRRGLAAFLSRGRDDGWFETARVCRNCQARGRHDLIVEQLESERGQLSTVEREIADKAARHLTLAEDIERDFETTTTRGQRLADRVSQVGGSWSFVLWFLGVIVVWVLVNGVVFAGRAFDPYPFILLNLLLSCLAALQGAILLIAAKRSDQIAADLAQHDYETDTAAAARIEEVLARLEERAGAEAHADRETRRLLEEVLARLDAPGHAGA